MRKTGHKYLYKPKEEDKNPGMFFYDKEKFGNNKVYMSKLYA
jgi:hypothetical protein